MKRVGSYFLKPRMEPRIAAVVAHIARIEILLTRTEGEALLLEPQLIRKPAPALQHPAARRQELSVHLSVGRRRLSAHGIPSWRQDRPGRYFGPFPSAYAVRESLNLMQKLFLVRQCENSLFRNRSRPACSTRSSVAARRVSG